MEVGVYLYIMDGTKTEYSMWNSFRSKLAAPILGVVENVWIISCSVLLLFEFCFVHLFRLLAFYYNNSISAKKPETQFFPFKIKAPSSCDCAKYNSYWRHLMFFGCFDGYTCICCWFHNRLCRF